MFGPFRHSVFRGFVFRCSVFRGSVFRGLVFRGSVTVSDIQVLVPALFLKFWLYLPRRLYIYIYKVAVVTIKGI